MRVQSLRNTGGSESKSCGLLLLVERRDDEEVGAVNTEFKERNPAVTRAACGGGDDIVCLSFKF